MHVIAFQCKNLADTVRMMKSNGVEIFEFDPTHTMVHPKSTHGILMHLVEKEPDAPVATKAGQVPDTSDGTVGILSYKCTVVFVKDIDQAIRSYEALGLKL
jgi:FtsP/CotA-like multicopper oxidase with cupredoxin domain